MELDSKKEKEKESLEIITQRNHHHRAFPEEIWEMLTEDSDCFKGKKILVPSSGDNIVAFAFGLLGASVTSTDIEQCVLDSAEKRANEHDIRNIEFLKIDTITLDGLLDNNYDFIFTSNGTYNCLHDIRSAHENFFRVLKHNGSYCFYDHHPFYNKIDEVRKKDENGKYTRGTGRLSFKSKLYKTKCKKSDIRNFYTIEDYINSLLDAGFNITRFSDIHRQEGAIPILAPLVPTKCSVDYVIKPKLPSWIGICARKS